MLKSLKLEIWMIQSCFKEVNTDNAFKAGHTYEIMSLGSSDGVQQMLDKMMLQLFIELLPTSLTMVDQLLKVTKIYC